MALYKCVDCGEHNTEVGQLYCKGCIVTRTILEPTPGHPAYLALLEEMRALHIKKAADYGSGVDPLANCRASTELGIPAWLGTFVRAMDKVTRIKSYVRNGGKLENESLEDSLKDLAAYSLIALVLFQEEHAK